MPPESLLMGAEGLKRARCVIWSDAFFDSRHAFSDRPAAALPIEPVLEPVDELPSALQFRSHGAAEIGEVEKPDLQKVVGGVVAL